MKISCLHARELYIEGDKRQNTAGWNRTAKGIIINLFMSLCRLHKEHKPITCRIKEVTNPLQALSFLSMLEIDLMESARNLSCTCLNPHKWVIDLIDLHRKFVNSHPLHAKSADEVLDAVKNYFFSLLCHCVPPQRKRLSSNQQKGNNTLK